MTADPFAEDGPGHVGPAGAAPVAGDGENHRKGATPEAEAAPSPRRDGSDPPVSSQLLEKTPLTRSIHDLHASGHQVGPGTATAVVAIVATASKHHASASSVNAASRGARGAGGGDSPPPGRSGLGWGGLSHAAIATCSRAEARGRDRRAGHGAALSDRRSEARRKQPRWGTCDA